MPPQFQSTFMENSGLEWQVRELQTGHAPFLGKGLEEVIGFLEGRARECKV